MRTEPILEFKGEYFFLSNFFPREMKYQGDTYASAEHAYQAAKCLHLDDRIPFMSWGMPITASQAKLLGRKVAMRPDWLKVRVPIMQDIEMQKFTQHPDLADLLVDTDPCELIEGNWWNDTFWGRRYVNGVLGDGENQLGNILVAVRTCFIVSRAARAAKKALEAIQ